MTLLALLLSVTASAWATLADSRLQVSTTTAQLGVLIQARTEAAPGLKPDLERSTTDAYSISAAESKPQGASALWTFSIVPLAVGKVPVTVFWKDTDDNVRSSVVLEVSEPAMPADADIADIKSPAKARPAVWPWLLAVAAAAAAWLWWKTRRVAPEGAAVSDAAPARPPDVLALEELAALEASGLWAERRYKEFYERLTDALRRFLERRHGMPALQLTTAELSRQLRQAEVDRKAVLLFKDLFDRADLVKFAKTVPEPEQGGLEIAAGRELVRLSAPAPTHSEAVSR